VKYIFIDESGDHNLEPSKIDPQFPFFILTGVVFDSLEYKRHKAKLLEFKKGEFGNMKIILHSKELTRPGTTKQKELANLTNQKRRYKFYIALNKLLSQSKFQILAYIINKHQFSKAFGSAPPDPYFLSFTNLLGKFENALKISEKGKIIVERRNNFLDKQFLLAWESARTSKQYKTEKPVILSKSWKESGLETADLISYRLARHFTGKPTKPAGNELDLSVIKAKAFEFEEFGGKK